MLVVNNPYLNNKATIVVGQFYIVDASSDITKNDQGAYIIFGENHFNVEMQMAVDKGDSRRIRHFKDVKEQMANNPLLWGEYEDFEGCAKINNRRIREAVARQYKALDSLLFQGIGREDALYMLYRIESCYKRFVRTINNEGAKKAIDMLNKECKGALDGEEYGISDCDMRPSTFKECIIKRHHFNIEPVLDFDFEATLQVKGQKPRDYREALLVHLGRPVDNATNTNTKAKKNYKTAF